ncbi:aromatic amino acid lyase [Streptomyces sp. NPDC014734]|uniref:aromatic amino acid lyase n=1 Tax=Streptomyces sp. NPDC014734 TaxID=3364886 RepID=UPI0036FE9A15
MTVPETVPPPVVVDGESLTVEAVRQVAVGGAPVRVPPRCLIVTDLGRTPREHDVPASVPAGPEAALTQENLVRSHSAGVGRLFAEDEVRAMMVARLNLLAKGLHPVRTEVLSRLVHYLNLMLTPAVPRTGSSGAVGDLTPLAHIAEALIGEGTVLHDGRPADTCSVLARRGLEPFGLRGQEALTLMSGDAATVGLGCLVVHRALDQVRHAEVVSALLLEVLGGLDGAPVRGGDAGGAHRGAADCAANLRDLLRGRTRLRGERPDRSPAVRSVAEVLGPVRDTLWYVAGALEARLNAGDGDALLRDEDGAVRGGGLPGHAATLALDFATIALTQLGALAERQLARLLSGEPRYGLPRSLVAADPALNSGLAGLRHTTAALVAENRALAPVSTRSAATEQVEGPSAPGLLAARTTRKALDNNDRVLAMVFLAAAQAVDLGRHYDGMAPATQAAYDALRSLVPALGVDRHMAADTELVAAALSSQHVLGALAHHARITLR